MTRCQIIVGQIALFLGLLASLAPAGRAEKKNAPPLPASCTSQTLRKAIDSLGITYGPGYDAAGFRKKLAALEATPDGPTKKDALNALATRAMTAHPLLQGKRILFVTREQYRRDHHNTATIFQTGEINTHSFRPSGPMKTLRFTNGKKTVATLVTPHKQGALRDPDVRFDGKKIIFAMRNSRDKDDYHIYTVNVDGCGLTQLTRAPGVSDIDPVFLPGGEIVFASSREPKFCMCNRHIMCNLFKMEADGANIHQIGKSTLFEGHPTVMPDGRILYDRWEYVDRNFGDAQGLWTVNPDGTNHALYWGNYTSSPGGVIDARILPGTDLCLAILATCHDRPWGAIAIIDRTQGVDGKKPIVKTWPASARDKVSTEGISKWDSLMGLMPKYEDPWPLDANFFLVSRTISKTDRKMALFLLDTFGNETLLHEEPKLGCYDPMPIAARPKPPAKPIRRDFTSKTGTFYLQDVYIGTHMKDVKRGEITHLRIIESPEKRNWVRPQWGGQGSQSPGMNWQSFENKRILGTVPVEKDGSAHFTVPADTHLYFQALDKNGKMIQSMRSGTTIAPGEVQGCVGCHESRAEDAPPAASQKLIATQRAPNVMTGWRGKTEPFDYMKTIQPIWDKHCVKCHDFGENKPAGKKLLLAGDRTHSFNASYIDLWSRNYLSCPGGGPAAHYEAKAWGSHKSKLVKVLEQGLPPKHPRHAKHKKVKLSKDELQAIYTWIDLNAVYYPFYECAYPNNPNGRSPLTGAQYSQLQKLTGVRFIRNNATNVRTRLSFERPEKSPCLKKLDKKSKEYAQALAIIQAGQDQLRKRPRADMPGFVPCERDLEHNKKYTARQAIEARNRKALAEGRKEYD